MQNGEGSYHSRGPTNIVTRTIATLLISLALLTPALASRQSSTVNDADVRKLLLELKDVKSGRETLATLFSIGDKQISELIKALDDPDHEVSLNAQTVIRYLGNPTGLAALENWLSKKTEYPLTAPIPLPLTERDYTWINSQYLKKPIREWVFAESYIYALAFDGSPRATAVLRQLKTAAAELDDSFVVARAMRLTAAADVKKVLVDERDLAKLVLKNAFFVDPTDRRFTSAKLLALNGAKQKALLEVYINRGPLAEEWYHVVLTKSGPGWRLFSITQVAVS